MKVKSTDGFQIHTLLNNFNDLQEMYKTPEYYSLLIKCSKYSDSISVCKLSKHAIQQIAHIAMNDIEKQLLNFGIEVEE